MKGMMSMKVLTNVQLQGPACALQLNLGVFMF